MLHALIMAGGGGTRFWPRSRKQRPKQFLTFGGDRSLLQQAYDRVEALAADHVWIITGEAYREETLKQLPQLSPDHVIGEPCGRDTAPCIALGAALIAQEDPEAVMMVLPADHVIEPEREFARAAQAAATVAEERPEALITFGIPPTFPSTGYGYVHRGEGMGERQGVSVYQVRSFEEKPKINVAQKYVASGEHYWNSGIFAWKASAILNQLQRQRPKLCSGAKHIAEAWPTADRQSRLEKEFPELEKISIDYAVMQEAPEVLMIQAPFQWDDVGSWLALERRNPQDADGNTIQANHVGVRTNKCVIVSDDDHLVATMGVDNLLIIQDGNATLIANRDDESAVKEIVELLRERREQGEKYL